MKRKYLKTFESFYEINENDEYKLKKYKSNSDIFVNAWLEIDDLENDLILRIDYIEVPFKKRKSGLGRIEVNKIIEWAKENGAKRIIIESERDAIPFWEKLGFDINDQGSEISTGILKL